MAWRVQHFQDVASTNDEARARALAGDPGKIWFVAERQSAGRGRLDRRWVSPRGNLHASALLIEPCAAEKAAEIGFVAGVALIDALRGIQAAVPLPHKAGGNSAREFRLKWPNDVLAGPAKLAGILVEGLTLPNRKFAAIVGIGVNCQTAPEGVAYPTTHLSAELGREIEPIDVFAALKSRFADAIGLWRARSGFAAIRAAWLDRAAGLGETIGVRRGGVTHHGVFAGLDPIGRLQLKSADGALSLIEAGDVALARI